MVPGGVDLRVGGQREIAVCSGTFLSNSVSALVMFDSGASCCFVSTRGGKSLLIVQTSFQLCFVVEW